MEDKLKKVMSQILKINIDSICPESSPDTIATWDSLQHMNLVLGIEQGFGITFTEEEIMQMMSYEIILELLKEKKC
jgi:acyl carrier protein